MVIEQDAVESLIIKLLRDHFIKAASHTHGGSHNNGLLNLWMVKDSSDDTSLIDTELMGFEAHVLKMLVHSNSKKGAFASATRSTTLRIPP
jgi:hypothetical protein